MSDHPYAGQAWKTGLIGSGGVHPAAGLQIIAHDLMADAKAHDIEGDCIELWYHGEDGTKGFFIGDTSSLPNMGWTRLARL